MLAAGTRMFLAIPGESRERILHPGKVIECDAESFLVEFEEPIAPQPGWTVSAYGELQGKFFKQGASVSAVEQTEPVAIILFGRVGQPVPAESRGTYRVCTVTSGMTASIGDHRDCPVLDISAEGMAAVIRESLSVGKVMSFDLGYEGETFRGTVRVQGVKTLPDGRLRYGLLVMDKSGAARRGLEQLAARIQRTQLRRLAGAA